MNTRFVSICFLAVIFSLTSCASYAATTALEGSCQLSDIDKVSEEILAKEIELLRLNTRLKLFLLPRSPWSARRQAGIGFTNATLTSVGAFMNGAGRFHYLYQTKKAPSPLFEDAGICRFLANCITTGAAVYEFCDDTVTGWKDRREGLSLPMMRQRASALQEQIDALIDKRNRLIAEQADNANKEVLEKEGTILSDLRNAETNEFALYFSQAKGNLSSRRWGYLITIVSNVTSGAGCLVGIEASHLHGINSIRRNHMGGVGGICDIISGSLNVLAPIAIRGGGAVSRHLANRDISDDLNCQGKKNFSTFIANQHQFETSLPAKPELEVRGVVLRNQALRAASTILEKRASMLEAERRKARDNFVENMLTASAAGGSKIANGVGGTVGAFKYTKDAYHRFEAQGGTALAYGAGNAIAALEIARVRMTDELKYFGSKNSKTSKEEVLKQQLNELNALPIGSRVAAGPAQTL